MYCLTDKYKPYEATAKAGQVQLRNEFDFIITKKAEEIFSAFLFYIDKNFLNFIIPSLLTLIYYQLSN